MYLGNPVVACVAGVPVRRAFLHSGRAQIRARAEKLHEAGGVLRRVFSLGNACYAG